MLRQLFDTVNGKYQKSKKIATDSNYLRCHALLAALHFPLETTWSCKQDRKERYWGQQRDTAVRPTEMTRPVTVDHLQSWSRIFRPDQTEMVRSFWWTNRNFRTFGLNGKRPLSNIDRNSAEATKKPMNKINPARVRIPSQFYCCHLSLKQYFPAFRLSPNKV